MISSRESMGTSDTGWGTMNELKSTTRARERRAIAAALDSACCSRAKGLVMTTRIVHWRAALTGGLPCSRSVRRRSLQGCNVVGQPLHDLPGGLLLVGAAGFDAAQFFAPDRHRARAVCADDVPAIDDAQDDIAGKRSAGASGQTRQV